MVRKELHAVRRPFFDCTSYRRPVAETVPPVQDTSLHLHGEMTRPLPKQTIRYSGIKVALNLAA